jgi:hypothetical protein
MAVDALLLPRAVGRRDVCSSAVRVTFHTIAVPQDHTIAVPQNGQQHPRWVQPGASRAERTHIHLLCGCEELFSARPAYALQHG